MQKIIEEIKKLQVMDRSCVLGIDGLSGAGKTTITEQIKQELMNEGYRVIVIHIDDLIVERTKRYNTGHPEWFEYYMLQWDINQIKENLLIPLYQRSTNIHLTYYEAENDRCYMKSIDITQYTLILIEGIFLQRKEWQDFYDYVIYLDCPKEIRYQRVLQRDTYIGDMHERLDKYERRYWVGEDYYLKEVDPINSANIVIRVNSSDWNTCLDWRGKGANE